MFILIAAGRLGMRAGEICHMKSDWVDFDRRVIEIPNHEPCSCGYCLKQAKQSVAHDSDLNTESDSDIESVLEERWSPKTDSSIRSIPFDFNDRVESTVICFFELFDEYEHSRVTVNRRVNKVAEIADISDRIYPHALRATAASYHAYKGLPAPALQSLFGWSKLETAQKYVRLSGGKTQKALNEIHDS
jgi:integrase